MSTKRPVVIARRQRGAAAVEFALVLLFIFVPLLLATIEFGRALYTWNSAVEGTRRGARFVAINGTAASVFDVMCAPKSPSGECLGVPGLTSNNVEVQYSDDGSNFSDTCSNCRFVRVQIVNFIFHSMVFFVPAELPLPTFSTTLPVEAMGNVS